MNKETTMKKLFLTLIIMALVVGGVFAQNDFESMSKNYISIDTGPMLIGEAVGEALNELGEAESLSNETISGYGYGFGLQYERQLTDQFSVAGRFSLFAIGMNISDEDYTGAKITVGTEISALSFQAYGRFYPFKGAFFVTGMLGYALMIMDFSGKLVVGNDSATISESFSRGFLNLGAMLGWRINFGGSFFYFEPALGYFGAIGLGDSFGTQLAKFFAREGQDDFDIKKFDKNNSVLQNILFVGGPRVALSVGVKF